MIYKLIKNNKEIFKNFSFLSLLQITQLAVGFILFPYLLKVLGKQNYGVVVFAQSIVGYFLLVLNYGFNRTATREIAIHKENLERLNYIISSVYATKLLLLLGLSIIYFLLVFFTPFLYEYKYVYLLTFLSLIGWFLYPEWYFQGIEKMENIAYVLIFSKITSVLLIVFYVKNSNDILYVPIFNSLSMLIAGVGGFYLLKKSNSKIKFNFNVQLKDVKLQLIDGFAIFFSNIAANTKDYFNTFIIGAFLNYDGVAIYDFANKIVRISVIPMSILSRVTFPKIAIERDKSKIRFIQKINLIYAFCFVILIFILPDSLWEIFMKEDVFLFKNVLYILILSLILFAFTIVKGSLSLVAFGRNKEYSKSIFVSILMYFFTLAILLLIKKISLYGVSLLILFSLLIEALSYSYFLNKKND